MTSESSSNNDVLTARDPHELLQIFESAEDLPTLPEVAVRLQEVVDDPNSSAGDVATIIEQDPAIATRVLRMVNSVFYAPARGSEITHLQPAIARLGFVTVTNIALSTSIFKAFSRNQKPVFDRREFWRHSITVGIITTVLQDFCQDRIDQPITRDVAHLSGIVHDMGKILFERYANSEFHQAINSAKAVDIPVIKEEARFIGMGHDEAGAWLAGKWKLAQEIRDVIHWHHDPLSCPELSHQPLIKLVHMADYICHNQGLGESGNNSPGYDNRIREELALTPDKIAEIMDVVEEEASKSEVLLSLAE
jgi:HD-like signal output (HDOD) protein